MFGAGPSGFGGLLLPDECNMIPPILAVFLAHPTSSLT